MSTAVKDAYQAVGSTITQNNGIPGQALHHLHVHVIPRFDGDAFQMPDPRVSEAPREVRLARAFLLRRVLAS
ncbi:HIT family protein [Streptomyces violaceus]